MFMSIELGYSIKIEDLNANVYEELQKGIPELFKGPQKDWSRTYGDNVIDDVEASLLSKHGIEFTVKKFKGETRVRIPGAPEGQTVHVHVPNVGLLFMTEVTWLEDVCTEALQLMLDEGWRILCVCPPNNQRRPDYILGRSKPDDQ